MSSLTQMGTAGAYSGTDKRAGKTSVNKTDRERVDNVRKHIHLFPQRTDKTVYFS